MTPAARVQAAIDILDLVVGAAREGGAAADTLIARYFAARRYAGSKDRRAVRELVYTAIRAAGEIPESGRAAMALVADADPALAALFDGSPHGPAPLSAEEPRAEAGVAPAWLVTALSGSGLADAALAALVARAPLDLRANTLKIARGDALALFPGAEPTPHAANGLRLPAGTAVEASEPWRAGLVEVQDEGSQIVCAVQPATPGQLIVDLCAGAGGKTLALAAAMRNQGTLIACDIDRDRLARLGPRAERAGATMVETRLLDAKRERAALADLEARADGVLVDAPCSGTGTWRRNPEARWRLTPARLERLQAMQRSVLDIAAELVRPGGTLVYIVCSLLDAEGADQVAGFLGRHRGWSADALALPGGEPHGRGARLHPALSGTDGFFVARLTAPC